MPRNKLVVDYEYDFSLYGLISSMKEYRLAWFLNQKLGIHLVKKKDIVQEYLNNERFLVSNFAFKTENSEFRLLKNRSENKNSERLVYLLPELHKFDFFIMKFGALDGLDDADFLPRIKEIEGVQYITSFDIGKIKSRENLIF
jgi:hypothetical protein